MAGYTAALTEAGIAYDERLAAPAPAWHRADGAAAMRHLLTTGVRPDAVFCFNDTLALGALRALHEMGLRVPEDVAVAGFDDIEDGRFSIPTLTTVAPTRSASPASRSSCWRAAWAPIASPHRASWWPPPRGPARVRLGRVLPIL
ncbi:substrate-binding domain-containing protein [Micromonospora sp. BRA006-A]|nr:substrate-binding domain-containing protein [Micromonospora sp. BRA006-A]